MWIDIEVPSAGEGTGAMGMHASVIPAAGKMNPWGSECQQLERGPGSLGVHVSGVAAPGETGVHAYCAGVYISVCSC